MTSTTPAATLQSDIKSSPSTSSSTKRTRTRISLDTRRQVYKALRELDPQVADAIEAEVTSELISVDDQRADEIAIALKHSRYARLTPFRATALFAEIYQDLFEQFDDNNEASGLDAGLAEASLSDFRHAWLSRQQADVLGMGYAEYIAAVFLTHRVLGNKGPPAVRLLHGPVQIASAALACRTLAAVSIN